uniref:Uncharacterized protein n=1 Tax=Steinernema glaseri TaxID=37863 RepID=A0A1I7Y681_9BILA
MSPEEAEKPKEVETDNAEPEDGVPPPVTSPSPSLHCHEDRATTMESLDKLFPSPVSGTPELSMERLRRLEAFIALRQGARIPLKSEATARSCMKRSSVGGGTPPEKKVRISTKNNEVFAIEKIGFRSWSRKKKIVKEDEEKDDDEEEHEKDNAYNENPSHEDTDADEDNMPPDSTEEQ